MNSVMELMERDHRGMEMLFREIDQSPEPLERRAIFDELANLFEAHARSEKSVVYSLLSTPEAEIWVDRAEAEHQMARELIRRLRQRNVLSIEWLEGIQVLRQLLNVHVAEEEGCVFPLLRKVFTVSELKEMAHDFRLMKEDWAHVG